MRLRKEEEIKEHRHILWRIMLFICSKPYKFLLSGGEDLKGLKVASLLDIYWSNSTCLLIEYCWYHINLLVPLCDIFWFHVSEISHIMLCFSYTLPYIKPLYKYLCFIILREIFYWTSIQLSNIITILNRIDHWSQPC